MNLANMRQRLLTKLRIPPQGDGQITPDVMNNAINEALRTFSRAKRWPWLYTSTALTIDTTGVDALPADFVAAGQLLCDDVLVPYVGMEELLAGSNRYAWSDDGTNVRVEPAPTASTAMTLWYYRSEADLTETAEPYAPDAYHDPIVAWAAHICAVARRDWDLANAFEREYDRAVAELEKAVFRKKTGVRVERRADRALTAARWS